MILGINFREHASRHDTFVFEFNKPDWAAHFEELITEKGIAFEKENHLIDEVNTIFYGVHKKDLKEAKTINYLVSAKFRKYLIADPILRYVTMSISFIILLLAFIGFLFN